MDGAGVREAGAFQAAAHGVVILVGVRPQMGTPRPRPGHGLGQHAGMGTVAAQAVEGAVWRLVIQPRAVDDLIGGVVADDKGKHGVHAARGLHDEQPAGGHVRPEQGLGGVAVDPLDGVAAAAHELPGAAVDRQGAGNVEACRRSDHISFSGFAAGRGYGRRGR